MPYRTALLKQVSGILEYDFTKVVSTAPGHYSCSLPIKQIRILSFATKDLTKTERLKVKRFFIWLHEDELIYIQGEEVNGRNHCRVPTCPDYTPPRFGLKPEQ